jgi:hypothetical protein
MTPLAVLRKTEPAICAIRPGGGGRGQSRMWPFFTGVTLTDRRFTQQNRMVAEVRGHPYISCMNYRGREESSNETEGAFHGLARLSQTGLLCYQS